MTRGQGEEDVRTHASKGRAREEGAGGLLGGSTELAGGTVGAEALGALTSHSLSLPGQAAGAPTAVPPSRSRVPLYDAAQSACLNG